MQVSTQVADSIQLVDQRSTLTSDFPHKARFLQSNEPLALEAQAIWLVQTGSLALFALYPNESDLRGRRRYLFNVKAGELIFAAALEAAEASVRLLAIALEPTELERLTPIELSNQFQTDANGMIDRLDNWIYQLSGSLLEPNEPVLTTPIRQRGLLDGGEIYRAPLAK